MKQVYDIDESLFLFVCKCCFFVSSVNIFVLVENTRKVSRNLGCKSQGLDRRPEDVEVLIPDVIQVLYHYHHPSSPFSIYLKPKHIL